MAWIGYCLMLAIALILCRLIFLLTVFLSTMRTNKLLVRIVFKKTVNKNINLHSIRARGHS